MAASSSGAAGSSSLAEWAQRYSVETTPLGRGSFASVSLWCCQGLGLWVGSFAQLGLVSPAWLICYDTLAQLAV